MHVAVTTFTLSRFRTVSVGLGAPVDELGRVAHKLLGRVHHVGGGRVGHFAVRVRVEGGEQKGESARVALWRASVTRTPRVHTTKMSKHQPDLIMCRKMPGIGTGTRVCVHTYLTVWPAAIGRLCEKCTGERALSVHRRAADGPHTHTPGDGKCVVCDSYVHPATLVRICDECNYGTFQGKCVICGGSGISDAYYCKECTIQEKDVRACSTEMG